jgi:acetyl-CoA acetyltransferase
MTTTERARDLPHPPAIVEGVSYAVSNTGTYFAQQRAFTSTPQVFSAPASFAMAGITPRDVDVLAVYDPFTIVALMQIEDMGFCPKGEAGRLALNGGLYYKQSRAKGGLPFNTHGGLLSHAYLLGICHVVELVRQIRGTAANQVDDCKIAVYGGYTGGDTGTLVLRRGEKR